MKNYINTVMEGDGTSTDLINILLNLTIVNNLIMNLRPFYKVYPFN